MNKKLIILQLNELNFDYAKYYIYKYNLKNFQKLLKFTRCETSSEITYQKLEPWIQWVTFNTGKTADEHGIFRLGEANQIKFKQIYERVEELGFKVGAITPMNTKNNLKNPTFFISDPWTKTKGGKNYFENILSSCLSRIINDNSQSKIGIFDYLILFFSIIKYVRFLQWPYLIKLVLKSLTKKWYKVFILELLLHELYLNKIKKGKTNFSSVFFNGIAHIQHHYFYNIENFTKKNPNWYISKKEDPFKNILEFYNKILEDYFKLGDKFILLTGLSQIPYDQEKFYYRLKNPSHFLNLLKINHKSVSQRMTRDFLIEFEDNKDVDLAENKIKLLCDDNGIKIFKELEKKDKSLFVTLTYSKEINENMYIELENKKIKFNQHVIFVALKNGMHDGKGFAFTNIKNLFNYEKTIHLKNFYKIIENYFSK